MIYPEKKELFELKSKAPGLKPPFNRQIVSNYAGNYLSNIRGRGMEFEEVREYIPGDDVRNIDWRVTARTGKPHLKVFREERERSLIVCVDVNKNMNFGTRVTFKSIQAARAAALVGWSFNICGDSVGSLLYGNVKNDTVFNPPVRSKQALWRMFEILCDKTDYNNKYINLADSLHKFRGRLRTGSLIVIISDFLNLDNATEKQLSLLSERTEVMAIAVNDPAEMEIPDLGQVQFSDNEGNLLKFNTGIKTAREHYKRLWHENREKLAYITGKNKISFIQTYTNRDIYTDLMQNLSRRRVI